MIKVTSIIFSNADPVTEEVEQYQLKYKNKVNIFQQKSMLYCKPVSWFPPKKMIKHHFDIRFN